MWLEQSPAFYTMTVTSNVLWTIWRTAWSTGSQFVEGKYNTEVL